jgi:acyl carrier protein
VKATGAGLRGRPWTVPVRPEQRSGHWRSLTWRQLRGQDAPAAVCCALSTGGTPMSRDATGVLHEIAALVGQQRQGPAPELALDTDLECGLAMDSAEVIDLLSRVEEHFDCTVEDADLADLTRVGDLVAIVQRGDRT